ncbi:hypothetical protein HanXRQr2_Chr08g0324451 [Helianthus annuus]|uniref:Uncharacterized protein n=1 Tax=Helianthus annuus TaxID=4232 RepID=A0A9K3ICN8_HELAN|nr:hypothetical protein HanXRQr2_Chr08g0324451 [Helianthus annuus]
MWWSLHIFWVYILLIVHESGLMINKIMSPQELEESKLKTLKKGTKWI